MKTIYLARHGKSLANEDHTLILEKNLFDHAIGLSNEGLNQADKCGEELRKSLSESYMAFVSPYLRATETLRRILDKQDHPPKETVIDGRLREQEWKFFKSQAEYQEKRDRRNLRGKLYYRFKNAESGYDVLNRVGGFYNQLRTDWILGNRTNDVLIVCHDTVIRCFLILALDLNPEKFDELTVENCQIFTLRRFSQISVRS